MIARMQGCKGLCSPRAIRSRYSVESPLDSTAIYPIIRSLTNNMRPVKYKPYQDYTFALRINPLEIDDDDLHLLMTNHLLDCASLGEGSHDAPPYTKMGRALYGISSLELEC